MAIGHPVDVPVLIHALACDYYRGGQNLSISNDLYFILSLDATTAEDDPTATVDCYAYSWWTMLIAKDVETMAESNIEVCLEYHNLMVKMVPVVPSHFEKLKYINTPGVMISECTHRASRSNAKGAGYTERSQ